MKKYYIVLDGQQKGPYSLQELKLLKISKDTLVWHSGLDNWMEVNELEELSEIFRSTPPPIPTQSGKAQTYKVDLRIVDDPDKLIKEKRVTNTFSKELKSVFTYILISAIFSLILYFFLIFNYGNKVRFLQNDYHAEEQRYNTEKSKNDNLKLITDRKIEVLFKNIQALKDEKDFYFYLFPDRNPQKNSTQVRASRAEILKGLSSNNEEFINNQDKVTLLPVKFKRGQDILIENGISQKELTYYKLFLSQSEFERHARCHEYELWNKLEILNENLRDATFNQNNLPKEYGFKSLLYLSIILVLGRYLLLATKFVLKNTIDS